MLAVFFATPIAALATMAAAASVPVVIHLLHRRRYRIVDWAAMRFLQAAQRQNVQRLRLEQWLLLAVRCAILVLMAMALAAVTPWADAIWQQLLPSTAGAAQVVSGRTHKVVILDGSLSMTSRDADGTAFDRARALATDLIKSSASGDAFSVILIGQPLQIVVPGPAEDAAKVSQEVEGLRCSHGPADLAAALTAAEELVHRAPGKYAQREVYVLSDLQRATWSSPSSPSGAWNEPWARLEAQAQLVVVDVGREGVENLAVTDLTIGDPLAIVGIRTSATATIRNYSSHERTIRLELLMGRETAAPVVVQQESATVPAGGSAPVTFPLTFPAAGEFLIQARLPSDSLEADDVRSLIVSVRDALPILLVNGTPSAERREQAASWLADALNPFEDDVRRPMYPGKPTTIDLAQLADPVAGDFAAYDAVFLCDVPRLTDREVARIETHLQRGGGLVIGLGPNVDLENYNRLLGGLLPGKLAGIVRAPTEEFFTLTGEPDSFARPPLAAFVADNDRAALLRARFRQYVRIEPAAGSAGRKLLTFVPPAGMTNEPARQVLADPLIVEIPRHRGRVVVITSSLNTDWTSWPIAPSFPPFAQELLRFVVRSGPRRTVAVGEALEDWLPAGVAATQATVHTPDRRTESVALTAEPAATRFQFVLTDQSGEYRVSVGPPMRDVLFAVNVAASAESDPQRLAAAELRAATPEEDVQIVTRLEAVRRTPKHLQAALPTSEPSLPAVPRGLGLARGLLAIMFLLLLVEGVLAWRFGSARARVGQIAEPVMRRLFDRAALLLVGVVIGGCLFAGTILLHAAWTNDFLGFLPSDVRGRVEIAFGVPPAAPGEGTRWRLEFVPFLTGDAVNDRWLAWAIGLAAVALAVWIYRREFGSAWVSRPESSKGVVATHQARPSQSLGACHSPHSKLRSPIPLMALRIALFALALGILLPQVRLLFEREGWPDLVVLIDDSRSMSTMDSSDLPQWKAQSRLALVQDFVKRSEGEWLDALIGGRQVKLHVFRCSERIEHVADIEGACDFGNAVAALSSLQPVGTASRLGAAVESILQEYRGSTLGGIVVFTDGVTTDGDDLVTAAQHAARAGVPLFTVGVGDAREPRDLHLHDLQVDDAVHVQDRLVFEARLTARGGIHASTVPVTLLELQGEQWKPVKRETVTPDPFGKPVRVRLTHAPKEPGEKRYALEVPVQADESDPTNNRLERTIYVAEAQRTRVLYIEGYARYEYRFLKTLLERESDAVRGNKSVELAVLLADADPDHAKQDRSAIDALPASREELFRQYDLVILGDVDPRHPKLGEKHLQWLADFVKEKGGGLLVIAGPQFMPPAYRNTPLADVLPVDLGGLSEAAGSDADDNRTNPYRVTLTPVGQLHPLFRLVPDETENQALWSRMMPLYWSAGRLKPKPAAEILAVRNSYAPFSPRASNRSVVVEPGGPSTTGNESQRGGEPLAVQQFVGAGRVLFFGFDESWRWRRREDERLYNQFWLQTVRFLARTRLGRCELRLDRQTPYRQGEAIRMTVRFPDDLPPPADNVPVQVTVEAASVAGGDVELQTVRLSRLEGSRATYEALVARITAGTYRFRLASPPVAGPPPEVVARVLPPPGELDNLRMNRADLERAALVSRGRYYALADADRLPAELPELPRVALHQPRPPYQLWSHPAIFGLGLTLIGVEWLLRKRRHLL